MKQYIFYDDSIHGLNDSNQFRTSLMVFREGNIKIYVNNGNEENHNTPHCHVSIGNQKSICSISLVDGNILEPKIITNKDLGKKLKDIKDLVAKHIEEGRKAWNSTNHKTKFKLTDGHLTKEYYCIQPNTFFYQCYNKDVVDNERINAIEFIKCYKNDETYGLKIEKAAEEYHKEFLKKYTLQKIKRLSFEDYCIGKGDDTNFCYWLERKLTQLGSILGSDSRKFGVYWSKDKNDYVPSKKFGADKYIALTNVKKEIAEIVEAALDNDPYVICDKMNLSYMLRHKIYYLYNDKEDIPIFSEEHLNFILTYFGINYVKGEREEANKRLALYNFKKDDPIFSTMTNREFMSFLYSPFLEIDLKPIKIHKDDDLEVRLIKVDFLKNNDLQIIDTLSTKKPEYNNIAKKLSFIGKKGEEIVLNYEKKQKPVYARKIRWVSKNDDRAGYDIKSYDDNGNEIHIEVKTKTNGNAKNVDFYITNNEKEKLETDSSYLIYYVCGIKTKNINIYSIDCNSLKDVTFESILYRIKAKIVK